MDNFMLYSSPGLVVHGSRPSLQLEIFDAVVLTASQIDPSLLDFLDASNAPEEAAALARLNAEIEPVIRRGLGYKLRFYRRQGDQDLQRPDSEEIYNDIHLRLLKRLRSLKQPRPKTDPLSTSHEACLTDPGKFPNQQQAMDHQASNAGSRSQW